MTKAQQNSVTGRLTFRARGRVKKKQVTADASVGRVPRIARLVALAIKLNGLIERGEVCSQKELAELAHVTPARLTQILNLNHLAPDIQEQLLLLPLVERGRDSVSERDLRTTVGLCSWSQQREVIKSMSSEKFPPVVHKNITT